MTTKLNDFETISTLDSILDDELSYDKKQIQELALPCACFQEDDESEESQV